MRVGKGWYRMIKDVADGELSKVKEGRVRTEWYPKYENVNTVTL